MELPIRGLPMFYKYSGLCLSKRKHTFNVKLTMILGEFINRACPFKKLHVSITFGEYLVYII